MGCLIWLKIVFYEDWQGIQLKVQLLKKEKAIEKQVSTLELSSQNQSITDNEAVKTNDTWSS